MPKLTLDDLKKLRDEKKKNLQQRETEGKTIQIVIGMGTCGIAAGAKETFDTFLDELQKNNLTNVLVKQTGCMGLCYVEPTVEVVMPGMPTVIYGKMTSEVAKDLVRKHLVEKKLLENHIFDRPAADIMKK